MGIIILPFLLGILGISVLALINIGKLLKNAEIKLREIIYGTAISVILFGIICLSYIIEGKAWALSPAFRIPFFMILIPFIISSVLKDIKNQKIKYFSYLLLISVGVSGILGVIFNDLIFNLIDILKIEKSY